MKGRMTSEVQAGEGVIVSGECRRAVLVSEPGQGEEDGGCCSGRKWLLGCLLSAGPEASPHTQLARTCPGPYIPYRLGI